MDYNVEEIERFGRRLEEQASNFQVATDNIDYDWRCISSILKKYPDEAHRKFCLNANEFGDGWLATRNEMKSDILQLSASMLGFYEATSSNVWLKSDELESLKNSFNEYYAAHPEYNRTNSGSYWTESNRTGWSQMRPDYGVSFETNTGVHVEGTTVTNVGPGYSSATSSSVSTASQDIEDNRWQ